MEDIETKLAQKIKPSRLMDDAKKLKASAQLRQKPKYQKMIEKNYDMCRSLRGYKNMQPTNYDFFQLAQQLKMMEKEKMVELAASLVGGKPDTGGKNLTRGFTLSNTRGKSFEARDAMAPFAHLFAMNKSLESSIILERDENSESHR
jgi:Zn-dependent metalloprotease